eukprot:scaffold43529_cov17-Prasinocladus_malaysianus.AAC.1
MSILLVIREAKDDGSFGGLLDARPGVKTWNQSVGQELLELALRCTRHQASKRFVHSSSVYKKRHCACCTSAPGVKTSAVTQHILNEYNSWPRVTFLTI